MAKAKPANTKRTKQTQKKARDNERPLKMTASKLEEQEAPQHIDLPPLMTDDIPARAGRLPENPNENSLNVVIRDDIESRGSKRLVKESE